ncbi:titin-like isoform X2 [Thunnus albacares]|uniref:titin-like isoform X2 n=1 Tax=Thunnus albacares TaxID=8236 RepID=UPI001CF66597|nr:titin-like isoform X2 [Thunnus albacares]
MLLLYFLLWTAVAANKEPLYGKIGDKAVLTSDSVVNPITSIEWKHGPDLAIEWYGGETFSYRHFKDRSMLNISTGALTITGLTPDDSGSYTVEINDKVTSKTQLLVISPVSKPTLSIRCEPEMTYCVLTCNGNTTGAEPVTYWWTSGDITWSSTKEHNITKEDDELWFSCAFENPVSSSSSEIVFNPFKEKEPLYGKIGDKAELTADSEEYPITSIEWKHGPDLAMEWYGDETTAYRHFKDRGRLNTLTGALTITGLTPDDSGNYTVEINNKVTSKTQLLVISPVSKPTLSVWCEPEMTYCVLTCNGDTTDAELITYRWTSGDITWSSTKEHNITMEDDEPWFSCAFENPVSSSSSEKVFNPFMEKEPLYRKIGDEAVLTPDSVENPITSIVWKHGPDLAMEWYGGETFSYRHFKDRGRLSTLTGALTITGLTSDDSDNYTVEINNKVTSKTQLLVISPVSKPTVSLSCEPEMTYCVLTCNGNTTGAEPVTYWWTSGDTTWSSNKHNITKENKEPWFSCAFENPVSFNSSEKVSNPFKEKEPLYGKIGDKAVLTSDSVVNPITSIEWKHGADLAMEWYGDETFSYRHFKDRGLLNTLTGALTITGLTPDDSGSYTVEINNKVTSKTQLLVISPVSKPTLSLWCEPEMTYCVLTCNGNTTDVELVTYRWTSDVTTWSSTKEHNITEEDDELWFSCAFENPVSSSSSEIVFNPFKEKEPLYGKIGDKAVLTPASVVNPITSIEWKHGADLAMEWYGGETFSYRHFKDRGSLNTSTGALTITGLTPDDSGNYTVEINNKVTSKTQLLVISPVSKPTLSLLCEPEMTYCVLTCNGNTTDAEPVTYWWTSGDIRWSSTKEHNITKENNELWFSCAFENPVSFISSEKVFNPFMEKEPLYGKIGDKAVLTPDSVVNLITSIEWKYGADLAMEWYGGETFSYRHFKAHGSLDTSNGALTITGLTPDDSGNYTVEINNKVTSKTELLVISPVSKPTLSIWCEPEMTYCVLTCHGNTTGAGPVTYNWTSDDTTLSSTKEHKITMKDKEPWFSCALKNPVSFNSSEKVFNPFIKEPLYGKIGDKAVLTPDSVVNPITSIEWKHGADLAMEWYGDETFSYRHFKDRGRLNISTGALTIRGLTSDDSGNYTVDINNKVTSKTELLVISPVSKPTLSLLCEPEMIYCVLTCNGDTTGAELVTYRGTSGDTTLSSAKEHNITKENNELWFSCVFENPVSSSSSEIVFNPFKENEPLYKKIGDEAVLTSDSVLNPITSIVWKHGPNTAMEWNRDKTTAYRHFEDRSMLNISNGALMITGLTPDDSGNYTVEINNILSSKTQLLVISPVSKPTLSEWCTGTYCVFTCNGNTTGAEPVTYWWTSGDTTWSSTKEQKITMVEKELWFSWFSCAFENPVSNIINSEEVFNPFIRNQLIAIAILLLVVCIIIITFRRKGVINFSCEWIKELLKWTFIYILACILVVFNITLIFDSNYEGRKEVLTRMFIMIAIFGVILVGFIIIFICILYKAGYSTGSLRWMSILIPVLFLDIFNIIINLIYEGIKVDLTWIYILIAVFGVILLGFIISIYLTVKCGKWYFIWNVMYMATCIAGLFNIIILMYRAINGGLTWMIIVTAILGVILVGFIIAIIYLIYEDRKHELKWKLTIIAVCIPVVFNIINSLYRDIRGDLTWMFNFIPVCMLVGFIIAIIYLIYKGIMYFRRKRREREAAERDWQEYLQWKKKGEADETRWQEYLERLDEGEATERARQEYQEWKRKGEAAERKWQEYLKWRGKKYLEWLDEDEAAERSWQERFDMGETAERKWQDFLERKDTGEATESTWQEFLESFNTEHLEWRREGEATEKRWQEYLERLDKGHLKWRRRGEAAERRWQVFLERKDKGEATERRWQAYLKWKRKDEAAERIWQERLERLDVEMSEMLLPVQNTSTQDLISVVVQDTSNGTERSTTSPDVPETSTQDQENAVSQDTSKETERSTTSPDVPETSTQDQETAESPDPSNETEKSAMIPDDLDTRC